jgi:site-specific recombinase XerC
MATPWRPPSGAAVATRRGDVRAVLLLGLRLAELVSLDWPGGLDPASGEVTVTGKRRKTRTVPVGDKALAALQLWLDERPQFAREGSRRSS